MGRDVPQVDGNEKAGRWREALLVTACVGAAFVVRAWALDRRDAVDYDETYYYILGRNLLTGHGYTLNGLPHTAFPPLYPVLVGIASFFTSTIRQATSAISLLAGSLLPVPVYFLGRDIHGRRAGLMAAAASAVFPALFFFAARMVVYTEKLYFGSEPLYVTLLASGMLFTWLFARYGGYGRASLAGAFFGLAALVRSEGPVVFAFLFLWLVIVLAASRRLWKWRILLQTALAAISMMVVFSPFLIYIHQVTGQWTLGAKLANNARIRGTLWEWVRENNPEPFVRIHYRPTKDLSQMEDMYWGVSAWHRENMAAQGSLGSGFALAANPDWRWAGVFAKTFYGGRRALVPRYVWAFVLFGLCFPPWNALRLRWWSFCLFNFLAMGLLAVSLYVLARHELGLLVLFSVALGKGLDEAGRLLAGAAGILNGRAGSLAGLARFVPAAAVITVMGISGIRANRAGNRPGFRPGAISSTAFDERVAAWLRENLPAGSTVMCNKPWIAVRAGMQWRVSPVGTPEEILRYALKHKFDYVLLGPWQVPKPVPGTPLYPYFTRTFTDGDELFLLDLTGRDGATAPPAAGGLPGKSLDRRESAGDNSPG